jgi:hypothetical protein
MDDFLMKGKLHKTFDITLSKKNLFFFCNFLFGVSRSPVAPLGLHT